MDRCEKLRDNLYGAELLTGSITPIKEHIAQIFYIVNNTDNSEFIGNEALQMITQFGKTEYHFCGRHSELWQRIFNDTALKFPYRVFRSSMLNGYFFIADSKRSSMGSDSFVVA